MIPKAAFGLSLAVVSSKVSLVVAQGYTAQGAGITPITVLPDGETCPAPTATVFVTVPPTGPLPTITVTAAPGGVGSGSNGNGNGPNGNDPDSGSPNGNGSGQEPDSGSGSPSGPYPYSGYPNGQEPSPQSTSNPPYSEDPNAQQPGYVSSTYPYSGYPSPVSTALPSLTITIPCYSSSSSVLATEVSASPFEITPFTTEFVTTILPPLSGENSGDPVTYTIITPVPTASYSDPYATGSYTGPYASVPYTGPYSTGPYATGPYYTSGSPYDPGQMTSPVGYGNGNGGLPATTPGFGGPGGAGGASGSGSPSTNVPGIPGSNSGPGGAGGSSPSDSGVPGIPGDVPGTGGLGNPGPMVPSTSYPGAGGAFPGAATATGPGAYGGGNGNGNGNPIEQTASPDTWTTLYSTIPGTITVTMGGPEPFSSTGGSPNNGPGNAGTVPVITITAPWPSTSSFSTETSPEFSQSVITVTPIPATQGGSTVSLEPTTITMPTPSPESSTVEATSGAATPSFPTMSPPFTNTTSTAAGPPLSISANLTSSAVEATSGAMTPGSPAPISSSMVPSMSVRANTTSTFVPPPPGTASVTPPFANTTSSMPISTAPANSSSETPPSAGTGSPLPNRPFLSLDVTPAATPTGHNGYKFFTGSKVNVRRSCGGVSDVGNLSINLEDTMDMEGFHPIANPHHRLWFSTGFEAIRSSKTPFIPASGDRMLAFDPANSLMDAAQISVGPLQKMGCFQFDLFAFDVGCAAPAKECTFTFSAQHLQDQNQHGLNKTVQAPNGYGSNRTVAMTSQHGLNKTAQAPHYHGLNKTVQVPSCKAHQGCRLTHIALEEFKDITALDISVTAGGEAVMWWGDDLALGWSHGSCEMARCRSKVRDSI